MEDTRSELESLRKTVIEPLRRAIAHQNARAVKAEEVLRMYADPVNWDGNIWKPLSKGTDLAIQYFGVFEGHAPEPISSAGVPEIENSDDMEEEVKND
jgi:hypothetical protein